MEPRTPYVRIWEELSAEKSMVFLAGPRQSGKTTLARLIGESFRNRVYFCWDILTDRQRFLEDPLFFTSVVRRDESRPLVILDEIHKHPDWKNYLKGVYDAFHEEYQFLVSGSGRLDVYQAGGDSLAGRYFLFHLWPLTLAELVSRTTFEEFFSEPLGVEEANEEEQRGVWEGLAERSGFPEPYLSGRETSYRRWTNTYSRQLIREDVRDLTGIRSVAAAENLYLLLPSRVGSPLSIPSLSRDLKLAYNTVHSWIEAFERFFLAFTIRPWSERIARSILKERKLYIWDSPRIGDPAARFENMVALELRRAVTAWTEHGLGSFTLHFIKDRQGREVDFLVADGNRPRLLVEAKLSDEEPSPALRRFQSVLEVPAVQLTAGGGGYRVLPNGEHRILVAPAHRWLARLP